MSDDQRSDRVEYVRTETETNRYKCFNCAFTMPTRLPECPSCGNPAMIVDLVEWRRLGSHRLDTLKPRRRSRYRRPMKRPQKLMDELGIKLP